jgi:hypothetical protein
MSIPRNLSIFADTFDGTNLSLLGTASATKLIPTGTSVSGNGLYLPAANTLGLSTNGAEAVRVDSSGNVGIGTSSGSARLNVNGGTSTSQIRWEVNNAAYTQEVSTNAAVNAYVYKSNDASYHVWKLSSSEAMRLDSSGNIGIGTSSPSNKLQVSGDGARIAAQCATNSASASTESELEAQVYNYWGGTGGPTYTGTAIQQYGAAATGTSSGISNANLGILRFQNGAGGLIYTNGSSPLIFATTATERMRIDSSGNVGIGTPSPASKFDVRTSAAEIARFSSSSTNGGYQIFYPDNVTTPVYVGSLKAILATGNATDFAIVGSGANNMVFGTNSAERMRIDSSGNVGIGTNSPQSSLQVSGPIVSAPTGIGVHMGVQTNYASIQLNSGTTVGSLIDFSTSGTDYLGRILYDNTSNYFTFSTNSTEKMRLDTNGNLGIGINSPSYKLQVNNPVASATADAITVQNNAVSATGQVTGIRFRYVSAEPAAIRATLTNATTGEGRLGFFTTPDGTGANLAERISIDSSGNLGIGTNSPSASAILDAQSTTKGVRMPNMTTTQKNAISSPAAGLMVFDTTLAKLCVYSGSAWQTVTSI